MKALGLGLGAFGFHEVWVEVERRPARPARRHGPGAGAGRRPRRRALAPVAHATTARVAVAMVVAESSPPRRIVDRDPDRHARGDGAPSTRRRPSRSTCSSSGPASAVARLARADARRHLRPHGQRDRRQGQQRRRRPRAAARLARARGRAGPHVRRRRLPAAAADRRPRHRRRLRHRVPRRVAGAARRRRAGAGRRHPERRRRADRRGRARACWPPTAP